MMKDLNQIISYWYDCIKNEDILEKDISIQVRSKAILYPFDNDPFIFNQKKNTIFVNPENDKLINFYEYTNVKGFELFYGYPILFYFDDAQEKYRIAPLFIIKVKFIKDEDSLYIQIDEEMPTCGIQAFNKLGFRSEEIADLSQSIELLFKSRSLNSSGKLASECIEIISKETEIQIIETINPDKLSNSEKINKKMRFGVYNKSLIFAGENTAYNLSLLKDLEELKYRNDLENTSISFINEKVVFQRGIEKIPVLPFPANEYQVRALQDIFHSRLTVITGPPGTGKSQYISNLLINLFLDNKSVLFVSHTNEAVDVVNQKINEQFRNLMIRTGKKEFRQELAGKFNELILDSEKKAQTAVNMRDINKLWKLIISYRKKLIKLDLMEKKYENDFKLYKGLKKKFYSPFKKLFSFLQIYRFKHKLDRLPAKSELEQHIRVCERNFYDLSKELVRGIYISKMLGRGKKIGKVKSFIFEVESCRINEDIDKKSFEDSLEVLKIWSSTLKSIRRTFPLSPNIFDYVIFDEASQVDLPSAAPALYRAKRAIVVGDPMQLTHVAGITKNIDLDLAKNNYIDNRKEYYPTKIRYCDVSLYKSSENSLTHRPILLMNHYRSENQIIALCNQSFYEGRLKIMTSIDRSKYPSNLPLGVEWIDCKGGNGKLNSYHHGK